MKNQFEVLEQLIGINPEINTSYFSETSFADVKVEKLFLQNQHKNSFTQKVFSDAILFGGYLVSLTYIIIAFQRTIFLYSFLIFFALFLLVLFFSYYSKNKKLVALLDHTQIFLISLNLNIKALIIVYRFNNDLLDDIVKNTEELLRIIIYDFITSNLLLLVKLEGKLKTHLFFLFMNLFTISIIQIKTERNHYFYLEGAVSTMFTVIFYIFRKIWEHKIRLSFAEKYKFENLFIYTNDFIQGLNGYHLNFNNDMLLYYDEKFFNFLNENLFLDTPIKSPIDDEINNASSTNHKKDVSEVNNLLNLKNDYNNSTNKNHNLDYVHNNNYSEDDGNKEIKVNSDCKKRKKANKFKVGLENKNKSNSDKKLNLNTESKPNKSLVCNSKNIIFSETQKNLISNNSNSKVEVLNSTVKNKIFDALNLQQEKLNSKPVKAIDKDGNNLKSNTCMKFLKSPISELNPITFFLSELKKYYTDESEKENTLYHVKTNVTPVDKKSPNFFLNNKGNFTSAENYNFDLKNLNNNFNNDCNLNINLTNAQNNLTPNKLNNNNEELMYYINQDRTKLTNLHTNRLKKLLENGENGEVNLLEEIKATIQTHKENNNFNENIYLGVFKFALDGKKLEKMKENLEGLKIKDKVYKNKENQEKENSYYFSNQEVNLNNKNTLEDKNDKIDSVNFNRNWNETDTNMGNNDYENYKELSDFGAKKKDSHQSFTVNVKSNGVFSENNRLNAFDNKRIIANSNHKAIKEGINNRQDKSVYNDSTHPNTINFQSNKLKEIHVDNLIPKAETAAKNIKIPKSMFNDNAPGGNKNINSDIIQDLNFVNSNIKEDIEIKNLDLNKENLDQKTNINFNSNTSKYKNKNASSSHIKIIDFIKEEDAENLKINEYNKNQDTKNKLKPEIEVTEESKNLRNSSSLETKHLKEASTLNLSKKQRFFDVYYRRIFFSKENTVYNIIFYDVTDLILARIKIYEENKKKHKVLAKMAHEFKTPLTSIVSLISILRDSYEEALSGSLVNSNCFSFQNSEKNSLEFHKNKNKNSEKNQQALDTLDLIQNLSRYVIFLTSDIIHYSNPNNLHDIELNNQKINFKEISTFCFDILKSLLYCNISKLNKIKPELVFDESLYKIEFYSDEVRIKQILLNFISNSVKFTNEGYIRLKVGKSVESQMILFSIEDSGIGVKEEEKLLLFKDFSKIEKNNIVNSLISNNYGSGLGLSICKNLATKLQMEIKLESAFGQGTKISLNIPFDWGRDEFKNLENSNFQNKGELGNSINNKDNKNNNGNNKKYYLIKNENSKYLSEKIIELRSHSNSLLREDDEILIKKNKDPESSEDEESERNLEFEAAAKEDEIDKEQYFERNSISDRYNQTKESQEKKKKRLLVRMQKRKKKKICKS